MAVIYLHIGMPKTGTTAVQNFLWLNRAVLEKHGICYPDFPVHYQGIPYPRNAHFLISEYGEENENGVLRQLPDPVEYEPILDRLKEYGKRFERIFLTDESIWRHWANSPNLWEKLRDDLAKRELGLRVIVYLRRQDNFILSIYRQKVKASFTSKEFHDYMPTLKAKYPVDFLSYMDLLSDCVGKEKLIIRVYEKEQFRGEEQNLFSDFLDIFGLSMQNGFVAEQSEYNLSLSDSLFELRRILNLLPKSLRKDPIFSQSMEAVLMNRQLYADEPVTSFFRPGEQAAYLESFAKSNSRLAKEYLDRTDGRLFYSDSGTALPEYRVDTDALLRDTILFYARVIQNMEKQNRKRDREFAELRENVILYRLKRKIKRLFAADRVQES